VEGMNIKCIAKHINKAGIRAEINETPSPVVIFIARDHNYSSPLFANVKENDEIKVRVIGQRFELNDKYISIIAEIVEGQSENVQEETIVPAASLVLASAPAPASASLASAPASLAPAPTKKKRATIRINIPKIKINN
jgi:hypothetical protein